MTMKCIFGENIRNNRPLAKISGTNCMQRTDEGDVFLVQINELKMWAASSASEGNIMGNGILLKTIKQ